MKRKPSHPLEFSFTSDTFNLEMEATEDGERIQAEIDAAKQARLNQDRLQRQISFEAPRKKS